LAVALSGWEGVLMAPDDDEPRLVLADQLLARGDPLGEYISLSCRRARLGSGLDAESVGRLVELWRDHGQEFTSRFGGDGLTLHFSRGLPTRLIASAEDWLMGPELPAPIQRVELWDVSAQHLPGVMSRPTTTRLSALTLRSTETWAQTEARVLGNAKAPRLRHLGLHHPFLRSVDFNRCLSGSLFPQLKTLEIGGPLGTEPELALVPLNGRARNLERLMLTEGIAEWPPHQFTTDAGLVFRSRWGAQLLWNALPETLGPWSALAVLGIRSGLIATHMVHRDTGEAALLLKSHAVCAAYDQPAEWFAPAVTPQPALLEPLDFGDADDGHWQLLPLPGVRRIDELPGPRPELTPVEWAAAFAPVARWLAEQKEPSLQNNALFLSDHGVQLLRPAPHLRFWHSAPGVPPPFIAAEMPPEIAIGGPYVAATAVFQLAARLAALLGVEVARGSDAVDIMRSVLNFKVKVTRPDVPQELASVLEQALHRREAMRPTMAQLATGLGQFRNEQTARAPSRLSLPSLSERIDSLASVWLETHSMWEPDRLT